MLIVFALQSVVKVVLPIVPLLRKRMHPLPKGLSIRKVHPYAIISLFDGVGSAIPAITKAIGCAPRIIIVAECDPILR